MWWVLYFLLYDMLFNELEILLSLARIQTKLYIHTHTHTRIPFLWWILLCMTQIRSFDALLVDCCKMIAIFNKEDTQARQCKGNEGRKWGQGHDVRIFLGGMDFLWFHFVFIVNSVGVWKTGMLKLWEGGPFNFSC